MGAERRRAERLDTRLFVDFETTTLKENLGRGVVLDVSLSGFGVETELDLNMNESYLCHIEIPLVLRAKLVRREIQGQMKRYGFRFEDQGFFDKLLLKKVLKGRRTTRKV